MLLVVLAVALCITGSALAAGLTLGLLSLDPFDMLVLLQTDPNHCDTELERQELLAEQADARRVHPLLEDHHRLLVTLMLLNCLCAEMLPLFLDELFPSWLAVLLSVTFILMFGEIIPSAIFANPKSGLANSAKMSGLVKVLLYIAAPVAIPAARLLDRAMGIGGKEGGDDGHGTYSKPELRSLLQLHQTETHLTPQQAKMMAGAMDLMTTKVYQAMTPRDKMFMLSSDTILDQSTLADILGRGFTRLPVFRAQTTSAGEGDNASSSSSTPFQLQGMLLCLSLIAVDSTDRRRVGDMGLRLPPVISPNITLHDVLDYNAPFFLVSDQPDAFAKAMRRVNHACFAGEQEKQQQQSPRASPLDKPPELLGCITAHDVIRCLVKQGMRDEFSSRKRRDSVDSSDKDDDHDQDEQDEQGDHQAEGDSDPEIGPEATKRIKNWVARARHTLDSSSSTAKERAPLLSSSSSPSVRRAALSRSHSDLADKLNAIWQTHKRGRLQPKKSSTQLKYSM